MLSYVEEWVSSGVVELYDACLGKILTRNWTYAQQPHTIMGMLKKAASGVLALLPDLRAHRLAALRGVRAHVHIVRSARQKGCGLARGKGCHGTLGIWRVK